MKLTLTPDPGHRATIGCPVNDAHCTVTRTLTRRTEFDATFEPESVLLTVNVTGGGTVRIEGADARCAQQGCSYPVPRRKPVTLIAEAGPRLRLSGWGAACAPAGRELRCVLAPTDAVTADAMFANNPLRVTVEPSAGFVVTLTPPGNLPDGRCRARCEVVYQDAVAIVLEARRAGAGQNPESEGVEWSGCDSESGPRCHLTLPREQVVTVGPPSWWGWGRRLAKDQDVEPLAVFGAATVVVGLAGLIAWRIRRRRAAGALEPQAEQDGTSRPPDTGSAPYAFPTRESAASTMAESWLRLQRQLSEEVAVAESRILARIDVEVARRLDGHGRRVDELAAAVQSLADTKVDDLLRTVEARLDAALRRIEAKLGEELATRDTGVAELRRELADLRHTLHPRPPVTGQMTPATQIEHREDSGPSVDGVGGRASRSVAPPISRWQSSLLRPSVAPDSAPVADPDAYLRQLRNCVASSRRLAEQEHAAVRIDIVHLAAVSGDRLTLSPVAVPDDPSWPLRCPRCENLPGAMTYQHFVGARNSDGTEVAVFLPSGCVVARERWAIGFKLLLEATSEAALLHVLAVEQAACLQRAPGEGDAYRVTWPMRLGPGHP